MSGEIKLVTANPYIVSNDAANFYCPKDEGSLIDRIIHLVRAWLGWELSDREETYANFYESQLKRGALAPNLNEFYRADNISASPLLKEKLGKVDRERKDFDQKVAELFKQELPSTQEADAIIQSLEIPSEYSGYKVGPDLQRQLKKVHEAAKKPKESWGRWIVSQLPWMTGAAAIARSGIKFLKNPSLETGGAAYLDWKTFENIYDIVVATPLDVAEDAIKQLGGYIYVTDEAIKAHIVHCASTIPDQMAQVACFNQTAPAASLAPGLIAVGAVALVAGGIVYFCRKKSGK